MISAPCWYGVATVWRESYRAEWRGCDCPLLLTLDAENTNIVLGVCDGTTLVQSWRLQTLRERTSDELGLLVDGLFEHSRIERGPVLGANPGAVGAPRD